MACERGIEPVVVVRAGRNGLSSAHVRSSAAAAQSALGLLSISVFGATNWETARLLCETHPVLRGRRFIFGLNSLDLLTSGFHLVPTGQDPHHCSLVLPDLSEGTLTKLRSLAVVLKER